MNVTQIVVFFLLPLGIALYALFGSRTIKVELLILAYVFTHAASGPRLFGFSFSFEKVISFILIIKLIFQYKNKISAYRKIIIPWLLFFIFFTLSSIINGVYSGLLRLFFDVIQILALPLFLSVYYKYRLINMNTLSRGFYRVGVLILLVQLFELYTNKDFYVYTNLSNGFHENYIGSVIRNELLRASSLFGEVSAAAIYALLAFSITKGQKSFEMTKRKVVFLLIIFLSGTRLGMGLALIFIFMDLLPKLLENQKFLVVLIISLGLLLFNYVNDILFYISSITRSGSESAFLDSTQDSSWYQRVLQLETAYNFLFKEEVVFGYGRENILELIKSISFINTLDSRVIMYLFFGGLSGLFIYLFAWQRLIWFNGIKVFKQNIIIRRKVSVVVFLFMIFSSIADYFCFVGFILPILYNYNDESFIS